MERTDRKFTRPKTAGRIEYLRSPQTLRTSVKGAGNGNWTKWQNQFADMLYGKALTASQKVMLAILYDQSFRNSNHRPGKDDDRRSLVASLDEMAAAVGVVRNTVESDARRLQELDIIYFERISRGEYRFGFWFDDAVRWRERCRVARRELAQLLDDGIWEWPEERDNDEEFLEGLVSEYALAKDEAEREQVLLFYGSFIDSPPEGSEE